MKYNWQKFLIFICVVLCLASVGCPTFASCPSQALFLVPPSGTVSAGQQIRFSVFISAHCVPDIQDVQKDYLDMVIKKGDTNHVVRALAVPEDNTTLTGKQLPANTYVRRVYELDLPQGVDGLLTLALQKKTGVSTMFQVVSAADMPENTGQMSVQEKWAKPQSLLSGFSWYEPAYFLLGARPGIDYSKFQFSFKYRLFNNVVPDTVSWKDRWFFAYTQTSYWDLKSDSMPFEDSSYKPEIFYLFPKIDLSIPWIQTFGLRAGLRHESNGKAGDDSRSTNTMYLESVMEFPLGQGLVLEMKPRAWFYVKNEDESNPDLYKYRGYTSLGLGLGDPDGLMLHTRTAFAEKGQTFMADISFPLARIHESLSFFFHVQYFNGYAEQLLHYREKDEIVRIGLSIVR